MAELPILTGIHHVSLTVTELDRSLAWYRDVLGFSEVWRRSMNGFERVLLARDGLVLTLTTHEDAAVPAEFSERRTGLDHLSFAVPDRTALDAWTARLDEAGVDRGEVTSTSTGDLLAFRDPDNIALEFYTRA